MLLLVRLLLRLFLPLLFLLCLLCLFLLLASGFLLTRFHFGAMLRGILLLLLEALRLLLAVLRVLHTARARASSSFFW